MAFGRGRHGFCKRALWFLKESFEVGAGLFLGTEDTRLDNASLSNRVNPWARRGHRACKYMRIYLWAALRIRDFRMTHFRMMDLRINGFWKRAVWFLKEGVMAFAEGRYDF